MGKYILAQDMGVRREHLHFANIDTGQLTWTPHLANPKPQKGKPRIVHDRIATILSFTQAHRIKFNLCNPGVVAIQLLENR